MDLRQYLDEMQEVGDWEDEPPADLPTIPDDEVSAASWSCLLFSTMKPMLPDGSSYCSQQ